MLRPFIGHFLSGKSTRVLAGIVKLPFENFGLVVRAWWLGFTTLFLWEVAEVLFDALIPKVCILPTRFALVIDCSIHIPSLAMLSLTLN